MHPSGDPKMRLPIATLVRASLVGALALLSLPGVEAARAGTDLLPPVAKLFAYDAAPLVAAPQPAPAGTCANNPAAVMRRADANRQAALARIAEAMAGTGQAEVLDGRGYGYHARRDPAVELMRIEAEARRLRALQAAGQPGH
jgi:hypothetical protein